MSDLTNFDVLNALCKAVFGAELDHDMICAEEDGCGCIISPYSCDVPKTCTCATCEHNNEDGDFRCSTSECMFACNNCKYDNFWNKKFDPSYLFRKEGGDVNGNECTD